MRKISIITALLLLVSSFAEAQTQQSSLETIKDNYRTLMLSMHGGSDDLSMALQSIEPETEISDQAVVELHQRYPFDQKKIASYVDLLGEDGRWEDINYADTKRSGWEPKYHVDRLLGEHVPYAIEAWPEGNQRHLSAESGLYCRIFTEGLFGLRPTGLKEFTMTPRLPKDWDYANLNHVRAFGDDFDIKVNRIDGDKLDVKVMRGDKCLLSKKINQGNTISVKL